MTDSDLVGEVVGVVTGVSELDLLILLEGISSTEALK